MHDTDITWSNLISEVLTACLKMQGLEPVVGIQDAAQIVQKGDSIHELVECEEKSKIIETTCQCVCSNSGIMESPDPVNLKEPLSAPF